MVIGLGDGCKFDFGTSRPEIDLNRQDSSRFCPAVSWGAEMNANVPQGKEDGPSSKSGELLTIIIGVTRR